MDDNNNNPQTQQQYQPPQDAKSIGFAILCFFFPIVGLILFLVWKDEKPLKAKSCGIGAIVGVAVQILFYILSIAFSFFAYSLI